MMKDKSGMYDYYTPLPEHTIIDVSTQGDHVVTVQHLKTGETRQIEGKNLLTNSSTEKRSTFLFIRFSFILYNFNWISTRSTTTFQHINEK